MARSLRPHHWLAAVTSVLAVVLLVQAAGTSVPAYAVGSGTAGLTAASAAAAMLRSDVFVARLAAVAVSSASGLLAGLTVVLGAPGEAPARPTLCTGVVLACAVALPLLLVVRARGQRVPADPYPQGP